jgi:hypothetical protein
MSESIEKCVCGGEPKLFVQHKMYALGCRECGLYTGYHIEHRITISHWNAIVSDIQEKSALRARVAELKEENARLSADLCDVNEMLEEQREQLQTARKTLFAYNMTLLGLGPRSFLWLKDENKRLREALTAYIKFSAEAYRLIDSDLDVKALKLLGAMAGKDGYRQDVDAARAALAGKEEKQCPRPKIVCLCGSTRFRADFERASMEEAMAGNIVLSVGMFGHETGLDMSGVDKRALDKLHFRKIELADEVLIVHPDYMGLSTCDEYYYAIALGKTVRFQGADEERA